MNAMETSASETKWLVYAIYVLDTCCILLWLSHFRLKIGIIHIACLLWCIIMQLVILFSKGTIRDYAMTILWPLLFEASYVMGRKDKDNLKIFKKAFVIIAIWGTFLFLQTRTNLSLRDIVQTNTIYFSLLTLPWLLLFTGNQTRLFILGIFTFLVLFSMKRSAMLVMALAWCFYGLTLLRTQRNKFIAIVAIAILVGIGIRTYFVTDNALKGLISERVNQEETDEGRGRLAIYTVTESMIMSSSVDELILGHGHMAVKRDSILDISAHNDFLEVIYDYGLLILVLYLVLWWYVFNRFIRLFRSNSPLFFPYAVSISIFIVMSMVSHLILYTSYFNFIVVFWGCIEGGYFLRGKTVKVQE